jgi:hypothetical protein
MSTDQPSSSDGQDQQPDRRSEQDHQERDNRSQLADSHPPAETRSRAEYAADVRAAGWNSQPSEQPRPDSSAQGSGSRPAEDRPGGAPAERSGDVPGKEQPGQRGGQQTSAGNRADSQPGERQGQNSADTPPARDRQPSPTGSEPGLRHAGNAPDTGRKEPGDPPATTRTANTAPNEPADTTGRSAYASDLRSQDPWHSAPPASPDFQPSRQRTISESTATTEQGAPGDAGTPPAEQRDMPGTGAGSDEAGPPPVEAADAQAPGTVHPDAPDPAQETPPGNQIGTEHQEDHHREPADPSQADASGAPDTADSGLHQPITVSASGGDTAQATTAKDHARNQAGENDAHTTPSARADGREQPSDITLLAGEHPVLVHVADPAERTIGDTTPTGIGRKPTGDELLHPEPVDRSRSRWDRLIDAAMERGDDLHDGISQNVDAIKTDVHPDGDSSRQPAPHQPYAVHDRPQPVIQQRAPPDGPTVGDAISSSALVAVAVVAGIRHTLARRQRARQTT